jgi:hypothetical protein
MKITTAEKIWNLISSFVFVLLIIGVGILFDRNGIVLEEISILQLIILMLATYRLTRIIVYDRVLKVFRDFIRSLEGSGIGDSLKAIITCPWCAGVWVALFVVVCYFFIPYGDVFVYIMAISGVATYIQLTINYVGLAAEEKQINVIKKREETDFKH